MAGHLRLLIYLISILLFKVSILLSVSISVDSLGQRTDSSQLIDIWYSIYDIDEDCFEVTLMAITASDETLYCESLTSDGGLGEVCHTGEFHIVWDIGEDEPDREFFDDRIEIAIYASMHGVDIGECFCGSCIDFDGNTYELVEINGVCWMAENLKTTHYRDGTPITNLISYELWRVADSLEIAAYCDVENDPDNVALYGRFYNWYAVNNPCGLCPEGWHVPSDEEFQELEIFLEMGIVEAAEIGCRGDNQGCRLAGRYDLWHMGVILDSPLFGISGFNAIPAGYRLYNGSFAVLGSNAMFWTSNDISPTEGMYRNLHSAWQCVHRRTYHVFKSNGYSVRCVKD